LLKTAPVKPEDALFLLHAAHLQGTLVLQLCGDHSPGTAKQSGIKFLKAYRFGDRYHVVTPGKPYKTFNPTFFITRSRVGKTGFKTMVRTEFAKRRLPILF
jgi:hypothetical protein